MELTVLEVLYIVLIVFVSVIGTLLTLNLIKLLRILAIVEEITSYYTKIKNFMHTLDNIPETIKKAVKNKITKTKE